MIDYIVLQWIIIALIVLSYFASNLLDELNRRHFPTQVPEPLRDVYSEERLNEARNYYNANLQLSRLEEGLSLLITLGLLLGGIFGWLDAWISKLVSNPDLRSLLFFAVVILVASIFQLPFAWYHTFRVEQRFGFNRTTLRTFFLDRIKSLMLTVVIGGPLMYLVLIIYQSAGKNFWLLVWGVITLFSLFMTLFYSNLIVPLFNRQTPLPEGELREAIYELSERLKFGVKDIYVIDGSKRSTKANAYFTGLGPKKRIVLYDTLINEYSQDEILAVMAHEIGHYRHKHTTKGLLAGILQTGIMLFLLSLFISPGSPLALPLCQAVGGPLVQSPSFHLGLLGFGILYEPFSIVLSLIFNALSRSYEYQADAFAARWGLGSSLISALKKLSATHLSNPDPHPWYAAMHYSHPTLLERIRGIRKNMQS